MTRSSFFKNLRDRAFSSRRVWLGLSLGLTAVYAVLAWQKAWGGDYVLADDGRQHLFWLARYQDPELFRGDLIADYFEAVAPFGYRGLYWFGSLCGVAPFWLSKVMILPLYLLSVAWAFGVIWELFPVALAAGLGAIMFAQSLGITDAIFSGTPKAFIYPLFTAFAYYLLRGSPVVVLVTGLLGLFYPQMMLVAMGVLLLRLWGWEKGRLRWRGDRWTVVSLLIGGGVLIPYVLGTHDFGPVVTKVEAQQMIEFSQAGRSRFFYDDAIRFWFEGRGGIRWASILTPVTNGAGFGLLFLPWWRKRLPLLGKLRPKAIFLAQVVVASLGLFAISHILLFRLHLPSRYTGHSLRLVMSLGAGIFLASLLDVLWPSQWKRLWQKGLGGMFTLVLLGGVLLYPLWISGFPLTNYVSGHESELYEFLRSQPPNSLVASTSRIADDLPSFAQQPVLVAREYAIPYHLGYYEIFKTRVEDLISAQYSPDLEIVQEFCDRYQIDFWLLNHNAFEVAYLAEHGWLEDYQPVTQQALQRLKSGERPALASLVKTHTVLTGENYWLLDMRSLR
ncbi:MAG: hypothetical protein AAGG02_15040 [Cyanobacteria bacterium P01_H01_bin.15]